jgi:hypothetical protein
MSTIQAQKARKQKKIAIVGGVILLALLAFLGPRTLKTLHGGSSSSTPYVAVQPTAATASSGDDTNERDTYCTRPAAGAVSASLADSDLPPAHTKSQLVSFDTFDSKEPVRAASHRRTRRSGRLNGGAGHGILRRSNNSRTPPQPEARPPPRRARPAPPHRRREASRAGALRPRSSK